MRSLLDPRRSLQARLALAMALLGLTLAVGIGIAVYALTAHNLNASARADAEKSVAIAASAYNNTGKALEGSVRDDASAPAPLVHSVRADGLLGTYIDGRSVWAGTPLPGGHGIYVRVPDTAQKTLRTLRVTLFIVGAIAVLLAALIGVLLARGLSRSLRSTADVADRIAAGDLSAQVSASGDDEVARLGRAIDAMSVAVAERIDRERRFSADVAHELRTPLTALVSAASLLDDSRPAQIVRERVTALRGLVEDLLEVLRLEQGREAVSSEEVDLTTVIRNVIAGRDGADQVRLVTRDDPAPRVLTDPRRIDRIVGNLIDNALRHGAGPVTVTVAATRAGSEPRPAGAADTGAAPPAAADGGVPVGATITVADSGPGFPPELIRDGPAPFKTGAVERGSGSGLGLVIAVGQAAAINAELRLDNGPGGGAVAVLVLHQ